MRGERTQPGNEFNNAQSILDIIRKFDVVRFEKNVCKPSNNIKNPSKTKKVLNKLRSINLGWKFSRFSRTPLNVDMYTLANFN